MRYRKRGGAKGGEGSDLERQEVSVVVRASLGEDADAAAAAEREVHRLEHGRLVHGRHHVVGARRALADCVQGGRLAQLLRKHRLRVGDHLSAAATVSQQCGRLRKG